MPFKKVNNLNIYYEVHGEGEPIILLHHGFGCTRIWKAVYPAFVARGFQVIMFDRRGFGRSEPGSRFRDFYIGDRYRPDSVEELKIIKEHLGLGKCHLVGQCEGGVVGVDYSVKYPGEIKTLTIASTQCYSETTMIELNAAKLVARFTNLTPELQIKVTEWHGDRAEEMYNQFAEYGGAYGKDFFDLRPVLPFVPCPTLVIYPDRSSIFDVEQSIGFYRNLVKGELAVFPRCGHNTYDQRPEDYVRTILDFISRNSAGGDGRDSRSAGTCLA
jgi:pimeloyl-ACP methyl ester carboxylesterase